MFVMRVVALRHAQEGQTGEPTVPMWVSNAESEAEVERGAEPRSARWRTRVFVPVWSKYSNASGSAVCTFPRAA